MATIFKKDKSKRDAPWYIDYFDENGRRRRVKGCTDRTATKQIARKLESDVELRRRGVIDSGIVPNWPESVAFGLTIRNARP